MGSPSFMDWFSWHPLLIFLDPSGKSLYGASKVAKSLLEAIRKSCTSFGGFVEVLDQHRVV